MAQSVDAARSKQRIAEREANDMHDEAAEARRQAFEAHRQLDAVEHERSRSVTEATRYRRAAAAESEAKDVALSEIESLRRKLAEAERRALPATAAAEAHAGALALYREKLGPTPDEPGHPSQLVAMDAVESRLAVASANSDLMGDVAAMASRREKTKLKHDLALMETMTKGLEEEVMRVQADGQALATALQRELTNQTQLKETAQAEATKFKDQARSLAHALSKLKEASYELESGMTAAATQAQERLRAVIDAILPAFDHHANLQLSGQETDEVFAAAVEDLGRATMALRHGRDELLREIKEAQDTARSATVAMEQSADQASITNAKLTQRIQGQADDIRSLQEGRVLDRAEFAREREELQAEMARLKAMAEKVEDNAMRAAESEQGRLKRAKEELRVAQQHNTRLQAELVSLRGGKGDAKSTLPGTGVDGGVAEEGTDGGGVLLTGWKNHTELKAALAAESEKAAKAEARAAVAEAALEAANKRSMEAAKRAAARVAAGAGSGTGGGEHTVGSVDSLLDAQALRDELQGVTERLLLLTEDNARLKSEKVKADLNLDRARKELEVGRLDKGGHAFDFEEPDAGAVAEAAKLRVQVQRLEREKAATLARAEAAEKRHRDLLQENRSYIGDSDR